MACKLNDTLYQLHHISAHSYGMLTVTLLCTSTDSFFCLVIACAGEKWCCNNNYNVGLVIAITNEFKVFDVFILLRAELKADYAT